MRIALICLIAILGIAPMSFSQTVRHDVADGETLFGIARSYGIAVQALIDANGIRSPELLLPGTILTVPGQYRVRKGDTLYSIARSVDVTVDELRAMNDLADTVIVVGQRLRVPVDAVSSQPTAVASARENASTESEPETERETQPPAQPDPEPIPVAASIMEPLAFGEGGAWPVAGARRTLNGKFPGVMIHAERGTPVSSVTGGRVVYSGPHSSFGNVVFVQSPQGYIYVYGGQQTVDVRVGQEVPAGGTLGTVGVSPTEDGAALYFSVWYNNRFVDPETAPRG